MSTLDETMPDLLAWKPPEVPQQDGDMILWRDGPRLNSLMRRTFNLMAPAPGEQVGAWFTVDQLEDAIGRNWASIGARLRDMRKPKFRCPCDCEHIDKGSGVFWYRLVRRTQPWPTQSGAA